MGQTLLLHSSVTVSDVTAAPVRHTKLHLKIDYVIGFFRTRKYARVTGVTQMLVRVFECFVNFGAHFINRVRLFFNKTSTFVALHAAYTCLCLRRVIA